MAENIDSESGVVLTMEKIIDAVRTHRNGLIKDVLDEEKLAAYYQQAFGKTLTRVKAEFIRRDLQELLIQPVDLVHYAKLLNEIKETNNTLVIANSYHLFKQQVDVVLKKYQF